MQAKSRSPARSRSPQKSTKQYVDARARRLSDKPRKAHKAQDQQPSVQSKTAAVVMGLFFLMFISSTIYSFFRSKSVEKEKPQRQQIAGLDIPREVIERMQKLRNVEDRERVLLDWADSQGITFENRRDGSYIALRDGQEYMMRPADPDFNPEVEQEDEQPSETLEQPPADEPVDEDEIIEPQDEEPEQ